MSKNFSGQSFKKIALDLGLSKSTAAFTSDYNYGVKHAPQESPRVITKLHKLRIERELARLKQHQEKIPSRKL